MRYPQFISLAGIAILACGIQEPDRELELALVFPEEILAAPDSVTAGRSFRATVATVGSRYCTEFGKTDVDGRGTNEVLIVPFNYRRTEGYCDSAAWSYPHGVTIVFAVAGEARILIRARSLENDKVETFEHPVKVLAVQ